MIDTFVGLVVLCFFRLFMILIILLSSFDVTIAFIHLFIQWDFFCIVNDLSEFNDAFFVWTCSSFLFQLLVMIVIILLSFFVITTFFIQLSMKWEYLLLCDTVTEFIFDAFLHWRLLHQLSFTFLAERTHSWLVIQFSHISFVKKENPFNMNLLVLLVGNQSAVQSWALESAVCFASLSLLNCTRLNLVDFIEKPALNHVTCVLHILCDYLQMSDGRDGYSILC